MTHKVSRRQLLAGASGIAAGSAVGAVGGGTAVVGAVTAQRAAIVQRAGDAGARMGTGQAMRAPGAVRWRAQAGAATPLVFLDIAAGYGMVYAFNVMSPPSEASLVCAFHAGTGSRAWHGQHGQVQPEVVGPGAVFWSTITDAGTTQATGPARLTGSWTRCTPRPERSAGRWTRRRWCWPSAADT